MPRTLIPAPSSICLTCRCVKYDYPEVEIVLLKAIQCDCEFPCSRCTDAKQTALCIYRPYQTQHNLGIDILRDQLDVLWHNFAQIAGSLNKLHRQLKDFATGKGGLPGLGDFYESTYPHSDPLHDGQIYGRTSTGVLNSSSPAAPVSFLCSLPNTQPQLAFMPDTYQMLAEARTNVYQESQQVWDLMNERGAPENSFLSPVHPFDWWGLLSTGYTGQNTEGDLTFASNRCQAAQYNSTFNEGGSSCLNCHLSARRVCLKLWNSRLQLNDPHDQLLIGNQTALCIYRPCQTSHILGADFLCDQLDVLWYNFAQTQGSLNKLRRQLKDFAAGKSSFPDLGESYEYNYANSDPLHNGQSNRGNSYYLDNCDQYSAGLSNSSTAVHCASLLCSSLNTQLQDALVLDKPCQMLADRMNIHQESHLSWSLMDTRDGPDSFSLSSIHPVDGCDLFNTPRQDTEGPLALASNWYPNMQQRIIEQERSLLPQDLGCLDYSYFSIVLDCSECVSDSVYENGTNFTELTTTLASAQFSTST
ncbi:hypothetical protein VKT23_020521 [Stygiomarasmius scandens]|uniref:Uncharacterized protein n=1 Tax=Marasmiellus scandens TaxID=2682957 RepID=A0ABR1IJ43_9AGAR